MLLAIDVGNTQTHLGAFREGELAEHWRFRTVAGATGDEIAERIAGLLALSGVEAAEVEAIAVSSVVPPLGGQYEAMATRYFESPSLLIEPGVKTGMPIRIDNPYEVGADRLVNAVAAYERIGGACIVVDFGTGINFDVVSEEGEYLGGSIAPGIEISLTALAERGALHPEDRARGARGGDRQVDPRRDPVGGDLRLRRPDRRRRAPNRGGTGRGALAAGHRRPGQRDRPVLRDDRGDRRDAHP